MALASMHHYAYSIALRCDIGGKHGHIEYSVELCGRERNTGKEDLIERRVCLQLEVESPPPLKLGVNGKQFVLPVKFLRQSYLEESIRTHILYMFSCSSTIRFIEEGISPQFWTWLIFNPALSSSLLHCPCCYSSPLMHLTILQSCKGRLTSP